LCTATLSLVQQQIKQTQDQSRTARAERRPNPVVDQAEKTRYPARDSKTAAKPQAIHPGFTDVSSTPAVLRGFDVIPACGHFVPDAHALVHTVGSY